MLSHYGMTIDNKTRGNIHTPTPQSKKVQTLADVIMVYVVFTDYMLLSLLIYCF